MCELRAEVAAPVRHTSTHLRRGVASGAIEAVRGKEDGHVWVLRIADAESKLQGREPSEQAAVEHRQHSGLGVTATAWALLCCQQCLHLGLRLLRQRHVAAG